MMLTLHRLLIRHWPLVLTFWVGLLITLRWAAPAWDEITKDGDFQYIPDESPSVVGQETLSGSFPELAMQSHLVGIVARPAGNVAPGDVYVAYDLSRRLHLMAGISQLGQSRVAAGDNEDPLKKKVRTPLRQSLIDLEASQLVNDCVCVLFARCLHIFEVFHVS